MKQIKVLTGSDSDKHLSEQVISEINSLGMKAERINLKQNDIIESYHITERALQSTIYPKTDFVISVADRPEQLGGVLSAFKERVPIGHMYAGDHNTVATYDDIHRHTISLYSDIHFCSCQESYVNVSNLLDSVGLSSKKVFNIGATHFDGIKIKEDIIPYHSNLVPYKYILILINSETFGDNTKLIKEAVSKAKYFKEIDYDTDFFICTGNGDGLIEKSIFSEIKTKNSIYSDKRIERKEFLSLIYHCKKFITNSSAGIYEAPFLLNKNDIIMIGNRNKGRTLIPNSSHDGYASGRISRIIKEYLEKEV